MAGQKIPFAAVEDPVQDKFVEDFVGLAAEPVEEWQIAVRVSRVGPEDLGADDVVFDFVSPPVGCGQTPLVGVLASASVAIPDRQPPQAGQHRPEREEVLVRAETEALLDALEFGVPVRFGVVVLDVVHVRVVVPCVGGRMLQLRSQRPQHGQVRSPLDVEDISPLPCPDVVLGAVVPQRCDDFLPGRQLVRPPGEEQRQVAVEGLVQDDLGVGDQNDLGAGARGFVPQEHVRLSLAKDLQVRVRFVDQKDAPGMRVQMGEDQKHLLKAPAGQGDVHRFAGSGGPPPGRSREGPASPGRACSTPFRPRNSENAWLPASRDCRAGLRA